jgi:hypothetical protein
MTIKNAKVKGLVGKYQTEFEMVRKLQEAAEQHEETVRAELAAAEAELPVAMDACITDACAANFDAETELRKRIADLNVQLEGAIERKRRAHLISSETSRAIAHQAIEASREEAVNQYGENIGGVLQSIADAKAAYLTALKAYHTLRVDVGAMCTEALDATHTARDAYGIPSFNPVLNPFYYHGAGQKYGVTDHEIREAMDHGIIRKTSVASEHATV